MSTWKMVRGNRGANSTGVALSTEAVMARFVDSDCVAWQIVPTAKKGDFPHRAAARASDRITSGSRKEWTVFPKWKRNAFKCVLRPLPPGGRPGRQLGSLTPRHGAANARKWHSARRSGRLL